MVRGWVDGRHGCVKQVRNWSFLMFSFCNFFPDFYTYKYDYIEFVLRAHFFHFGGPFKIFPRDNKDYQYPLLIIVSITILTLTASNQLHHSSEYIYRLSLDVWCMVYLVKTFAIENSEAHIITQQLRAATNKVPGNSSPGQYRGSASKNFL